MAFAGTFPQFANEHRTGLAVSVAGHLTILLALSTTLIFTPKQPAPQLAIEAVVIDESAVQRAAEAERRKTEAAAQRRREEQQRIAQQERERKAAEQRRQQQVAAEAERKRQAEAKRVEEARLAEERARVEKEKRAAEQRAQEERKRREAEARAEAERQRMLEAAEREEQERREAELRASMAAEEALQAARQSDEMSVYLALIQQRVERNWSRPATAKPGLECEVAVMQLPSGEVVNVRIERCNGDEVVKRSIIAAVERASPLPLPENRLLFERNLKFLFRPE